MRVSNPGPTGEMPVFKHYTNDFSADKGGFNNNYQENSNYRSNEYNNSIANINTSENTS